jgi:hypothetical protein
MPPSRVNAAAPHIDPHPDTFSLPSFGRESFAAIFLITKLLQFVELERVRLLIEPLQVYAAVLFWIIIQGK